MLGSSLCKQYHPSHEVHAFHRDEKSYVKCSADHRIDLSEAKEVERHFNDFTPDIVIHCAGLTNIDLCEIEPEKAYMENVKATENLARACSESATFYYISTDQVYGASIDRSEEAVNLHPLNVYGNLDNTAVCFYLSGLVR